MSKRLSRAAGCTGAGGAGGSGGFGAKKRLMKSNSNTHATVKYRDESRKPRVVLRKKRNARLRSPKAGAC